LNKNELDINKIDKSGVLPDNASVAGLSPLKDPSKKHFNHHYLSQFRLPTNDEISSLKFS